MMKIGMDILGVALTLTGLLWAAIAFLLICGLLVSVIEHMLSSVVNVFKKDDK